MKRGGEKREARKEKGRGGMQRGATNKFLQWHARRHILLSCTGRLRREYNTRAHLRHLPRSCGRASRRSSRPSANHSACVSPESGLGFVLQCVGPRSRANSAALLEQQARWLVPSRPAICSPNLGGPMCILRALTRDWAPLSHARLCRTDSVAPTVRQRRWLVALLLCLLLLVNRPEGSCPWRYA